MRLYAGLSMEHVAGVTRGQREYVLLDEQLVVYEKVLLCAREGFYDRRKTVLVVKGGPGTGKSVIAINLMADLLRGEYNTHYATGSKAFTETLRLGSVRLIRDHAERLGSRIFEYQLEAQFRCAGSDAFVNWIDNTLEVARTAHAIWEQDESFDFRIVSSPEDLEALIRSKAAAGSSARLTAGFCWKWSRPRDDGTLVDDVVIGSWRHPWNAKHEARKLAPGIPKAQLWAHDPKGLDQVGCVYTAQGFELDYVGVIWGPDLVRDPDRQVWVGRPEHSHDSVVKRSKQAFTDLVKNTYRVLLSRGLKGCYVCFSDRDTERFVRSRMG